LASESWFVSSRNPECQYPELTIWFGERSYLCASRHRLCYYYNTLLILIGPQTVVLSGLDPLDVGIEMIAKSNGAVCFVNTARPFTYICMDEVYSSNAPRESGSRMTSGDTLLFCMTESLRRHFFPPDLGDHSLCLVERPSALAKVL
jgi:hypothetical protein